jgi:hypothetical protein
MVKIENRTIAVSLMLVYFHRRRIPAIAIVLITNKKDQLCGGGCNRRVFTVSLIPKNRNAINP